MYYGEKLNSITHLVGAVLSVMGLGALVSVSINQGHWKGVVGFSIYGITLVLLYTMSTLYHSFQGQALKRIFQKFDHIAIYCLIAGTYTPYMMVSLDDGNGALLLTSVWGLAVLGIVLDLFVRRRIEVLQLIIYLAMGWLIVFDYSNLSHAIGSVGMFWLVLGGLAYTGGVIFYVLDHQQKLVHAHGIWHLFVLIGSTSHFISIIGYVR
jgi:hemolysin III